MPKELPVDEGNGGDDRPGRRETGGSEQRQGRDGQRRELPRGHGGKEKGTRAHSIQESKDVRGRAKRERDKSVLEASRTSKFEQETRENQDWPGGRSRWGQLNREMSGGRMATKKESEAERGVQDSSQLKKRAELQSERECTGGTSVKRQVHGGKPRKNETGGVVHKDEAPVGAGSEGRKGSGEKIGEREPQRRPGPWPPGTGRIATGCQARTEKGPQLDG